MDASAELFAHLSTVSDPEIPVLTLADMGILRKVERLDANHPLYVEALEQFEAVHGGMRPKHEEWGAYNIVISPTYVGCPAMDRMKQDIEEALYVKQVPFVVTQQLQPAWTTAWITAEGRKKMEAYGIAPPVEGTADKRTLFAEAPKVPCPKCKSKKTKMLSVHGSTACKSQYQCGECLEPFEYFKCL